MNLRKKLFLFTLIVLAGWGVVYTYNQVTDGFNIRQITSSLPVESHIENEPLSLERKEELQKILDQPFSYIGKGCQFYVFQSEDGKYVIKLLKHKHLRPFTWLAKIPMPKKLRTITQDKMERRKKRVENLFSSCKLAFDEMQEETGVVFIHLNRSVALEKKITLINKVGVHSNIEIDNYEFVLQKRAILVKEIFQELQKEGETREKVNQLVDLVLARCKKGICDRDRSFVQNVAFCVDGTRAVFVDIGQFYKDPSILEEEKQREDLRKRRGNLRHWTKRHFPELINYID